MQSPRKAARIALLLGALTSLSCAGRPAGNASTTRDRTTAESAGASSDERAAGAAQSLVGSRESPSATGRATRWELWDKLPTLRRASARARSQHMNGNLDAEVLANEEARAYPTLGPSRRLDPGAVLVAAHFSADTPVVLFAMAKQRPGFDPEGGDWEYLIVEPGGEVRERGRLPLCARCHAEAPHDHLFGAPAGPPAAP